MIVRRINDDELKRTSELFCIAFEFDMDNSKSAQEVFEEAKNNPQGRGDLYINDKWAAFDDENNMMAFISTLPLNAQFDGNVVKMTGIGGVSTLPQYRRHGAIKECFNESLKYAYDNDFILSYLYPFSSGYYGKFGYELCNERIIYKINIKSIKRFEEADGQFYLVENGTHLDDAKKVYSDFAKPYNLMCVRDDIDYGFIKNANPAKTKEYTYIYKSKSGEAKALLSFTKQNRDGKFDMVCQRFYFSDMEGFKALLNHSLAYASYYEHIEFSLPLDINITSYIPEWALYSYSRSSYFNGMVRVVNVKKALSMAKYRGTGSLVVKIEDKQITENNGTFEIVFENDKAASVEKCDKEYDIAMTINDFSRLLIGTHSEQELKFIERLDIKADLEKIGKVFYKKLNFIADYF